MAGFPLWTSGPPQRPTRLPLFPAIQRALGLPGLSGVPEGFPWLPVKLRSLSTRRTSDITVHRSRRAATHVAADWNVGSSGELPRNSLSQAKRSWTATHGRQAAGPLQIDGGAPSTSKLCVSYCHSRFGEARPSDILEPRRLCTACAAAAVLPTSARAPYLRRARHCRP